MARHYESVTAEAFTGEELAGWLVRGTSVHAVVSTRSFVRGVALVEEIARLAEEVDHHPDLLLTYPRVEIRLTTHATSSLTTVDVDLARAITRAVRDAGLVLDAEGVGELASS